MAHKDDFQPYSQQPYQQQQATAYSGVLGNLLGSAYGGIAYGIQQASAYASFSINSSFSGMGIQQYHQQMMEMQTKLGTPTAKKLGSPDPSEIAWLKGRIREVEWRG